MLQLKLTCFLLLFGAISASHEENHKRHPQKYLQEEKTVEVSPEFLDQPESIHFIPLSKVHENVDNEDVENSDDADRFEYNVVKEKTSETEENNNESENEIESNFKPPQETDDLFLDSFFPTLWFLLSQPIFDEMIPQSPQQQIVQEPPVEEKEEPIFFFIAEPNEPQKPVGTELNLDINIDIKMPNLGTSRAVKPINKLKRIIKQQKRKLQNKKQKQERKRLRKLWKKIQKQMQNHKNTINPFRRVSPIRPNRKNNMNQFRRFPPMNRKFNKPRGRKFNNKMGRQNPQTTLLFFDPIENGLPNQNIYNEPSIFDFFSSPPNRQQNKPDIPKQGSSSIFDILFLPPSAQQQKSKQDDIIFIDFGGAPQQQNQPSLLDMLFMPPQPQQQQQQQQQQKQDDIIFIDFGGASKNENSKQSSPFDFLFFPSLPQQQQPKQEDIIFFDLGESPKSGKKDQSSMFDIFFFPSPAAQNQQQQPQSQPSKDIPIYFDIILPEASQINEKSQFKSEPTLFDFLMQSQQLQEPQPAPKQESRKSSFFDFMF